MPNSGIRTFSAFQPTGRGPGTNTCTVAAVGGGGVIFVLVSAHLFVQIGSRWIGSRLFCFNFNESKKLQVVTGRIPILI